METPIDHDIVHAEEDADFDQIFRIRELVFERELGVPEEAQIDGFDAVAHHYIVLLGNEAVGVGRWRITLGGNVRLDRIAILQQHRRQGLGKSLISKMLKHVPKSRQTSIECLVSQEAYFRQFGFERDGEDFDFSGLPHLRMVLKG